MNAWRVSAWIVVGGLATAWLSSAAGVVRPGRAVRTPQRPASATALDQLAGDMDAQTGRLRKRLDAVPVPRGDFRNPFSFTSKAAPRLRLAPVPVAEPAPIPAIPVPVEPSLELIGIAEKKTLNSVVRTAMLSGEQGELLMVAAGQQVLGLYDVVAVSADAVELKHLTTGATRRLRLQ